MRVVKIREYEANPRQYLFLVSLFKLVREKFNYANPMSTEKLKSEKIWLPFYGESLAFSYMDEYIKQIEEEYIKTLELELEELNKLYLSITNLEQIELTHSELLLLEKMPKFKSIRLSSTYVMRGKIVEVDENGIFDIIPTRKKINANQINFDGSYPYVSRGENKNGIKGYIDYNKAFLNPQNTISFGQDTATMHYQKVPYFTGDKILIFQLNNKYGVLNENIALYLISSMKKIFSNYKWGQQSFGVDAISELSIELPINKYGSIDFDFMDKFVDIVKKKIIGEVLEKKEIIISETKNIVRK